MIATLLEEMAEPAAAMGNASGSLTHLTRSDVDAGTRKRAAAGFEGTAAEPIIDDARPDENGEYSDVDQSALHHHIHGPAYGIREHRVSPELLRMARDDVRAL